LKYFAKDDGGNCVGTEPQKSYTDEELDEMFGIGAIASLFR
jgi:hypothetical protein